MGTRISIVFAAGGCGLLLTVPAALSQGTLTPPGAPAPTMKTLSQIEPRTPISSLPYTIGSAGSYYVTTNLAVSSAVDGITIAADNVSLDLSGFTLTGFGTANSAINTPSARYNLAIRNGTVRNWGAGVNVGLAYNSQFENLLLCNNTANAGLQTWDKCTVTACVASSNLAGILVHDGCLVKDCNTSWNSNGIVGGSASVIVGCVSTLNDGWGITVGTNSTLSTCTAARNGRIGQTGGILTGDNCTLIGCSANFNNTTNALSPTSKGIKTGSACLIKDCIANQNQADGILALAYCNIQDCIAVGNTGGSEGNGIVAGAHSIVRGCVLNNNYGIGIGGYCLIMENNCDDLLGDVFTNGTTNSVVIRNAFSGSIAVSGSSGNAVGTIENASSMNTNKNPHANFKP